MDTYHHLQGVEDQPALPQALTNIIGTSHIFEIKSHTYYEHGTYESFTCWQICEPLPSVETASTNNVIAIADVEKPALKILTEDPPLCTPLKISEGKRRQGLDFDIAININMLIIIYCLMCSCILTIC